jgi:hypothetical protein
MTWFQVALSRAFVGTLVAPLALALMVPSPASADIVLAPWAGDIVLVGTQSNAGPVQDIQSQSGPGFEWGTTLQSSAHDNISHADASALMTISNSFSTTSLGGSSVGQGTTGNSGGTNKGGVLMYVQFVVTQTQQYHSETTLIPGSWGSSSSLVFISNLMSDQLAVVSLIGGPGSFIVDGRLPPGNYIYYYTNSYSTEGVDGTSNTLLSGVDFTDVPNPLIQQHPQSQTVNQGATTSFSVGAGGPVMQNRAAVTTTALGYQWRRDYVNLSDGGRITGATTNHLVITNTAFADTGLYDCVVTQGTIVEPSSAAKLTVVSGTNAVDPLAATTGMWLSTPSPNPFTSRTLVHFALPHETAVELDVIDVSGRRVRVLARGESLGAGTHDIAWDGATDRGNRAPGGMYFVRLRAGSRQLATRVVQIAP